MSVQQDLEKITEGSFQRQKVSTYHENVTRLVDVGMHSATWGQHCEVTPEVRTVIAGAMRTGSPVADSARPINVRMHNACSSAAVISDAHVLYTTAGSPRYFQARELHK